MGAPMCQPLPHEWYTSDARDAVALRVGWQTLTPVVRGATEASEVVPGASDAPGSDVAGKRKLRRGLGALGRTALVFRGAVGKLKDSIELSLRGFLPTWSWMDRIDHVTWILPLQHGTCCLLPPYPYGLR